MKQPKGANTTWTFDDGSLVIERTLQPKGLRNAYRMTVDLFICPKPFRDLRLIEEARYSMDIPNAGGSSDVSEALSMQYMHNKFGASDFIPEMDVPYWIEYKMCDYLMMLKGEWVGVSVTRAVPYPFKTGEFTFAKAKELLERKLYGLIVAREAIMEEYGFSKSVLHVWCYNSRVASLIEAAHDAVIAAEEQKTYDQVHVICTVCPHEYVYTNRPSQR